MTKTMEDKVYNFIIEFKRANGGNSPGREEIAEGVGLKSKSNIPLYLSKLELAGRIRLAPTGIARYILVVGEKWLSPEEVETMKRES